MVRAWHLLQVNYLSSNNFIIPIRTDTLNGFNLQACHGQDMRQFFWRYSYVNIIFQPAQWHFHRLVSSLGTPHFKIDARNVRRYLRRGVSLQWNTSTWQYAQLPYRRRSRDISPDHSRPLVTLLDVPCLSRASLTSRCTYRYDIPGH